MLNEYTFQLEVKGIGTCESEALEAALDGLCTENVNAEVIRVTPVAGEDDGEES
jgi:hypothetical protein